MGASQNLPPTPLGPATAQRSHLFHERPARAASILPNPTDATQRGRLPSRLRRLPAAEARPGHKVGAVWQP